MAFSTYQVVMADQQRWTLYADLGQRTAQLSANFTGEPDGDVVTPFQTCDVHDLDAAAERVAEYFAEPGDSTEVVAVQEVG